MLGLDFGGTKTAIALCDESGRVLASSVLATRPERGAPAVLDQAVLAARELLSSTAGGAHLSGVGVATIGVPRPARVELAPAIPGWDETPLAAEIQGAFEVPVAVANDVKAAAMAEARWGALRGADPAIYLNLGTGLGAAILVGGRPLSGAHGASGEIGYNLVEARHLHAAPGSHPTLEDTVSGMGLAQRGSHLVGRGVSADEVFDLATAGSALGGAVKDFADQLGLHLVNLVIAVDPARVAVGGGIVRSWARVHGPLEAALRCAVPYPPELVRATYPDDAPLIGALVLGAEAAGISYRDGAELTGGVLAGHRRRHDPSLLQLTDTTPGRKR